MISRNRIAHLAPYLLLLCVACVTIFFRLGSLPFIGADEPRYARIAEEMYRSGRWVTPTLEGYPWLEKPPLYYWMTIPCYAVWGVSETTARLAPAMSALLTAWVVCWAAGRLWGTAAGLLSGSLLLTSAGFIVFARGASTDMPFTACFTVAMVLLVLCLVEEAGRRVGLVAAYFFVGLAVLAKGPVALVLCAGTVLLFWVFDERGSGIRRLRLIWGLGAATAVAAPWFLLAFLQNGFAFIAVFFINHHLARFVSEVHHHAEPFYYFVPVLLGLCLPWTGWALALGGRGMRALKEWRRWPPARLFLWCWLAFPVLFFSLSESKLPGYVLVSLPPLAMLVAQGQSRLFGASIPDKAGAAAGWLQLLISAALAAAFPVAVSRIYGESWTEGMPLVLAVVLPAIACVAATAAGRWRTAVALTVVQGLIMAAALTQFAFPLIAGDHSTREIAQQALAARTASEPIVTYRFFHHTLDYYTGYRVEADLEDKRSLESFAASHPRFLTVTEERYLSEIESIPGLYAAVLGRQGKFRLLLLVRR